MELSIIKKQLKPLGFTIETKTMGFDGNTKLFGKLRHIQSGKLISGLDTFSQNELAFWLPAFTIIRSALPITKNNEKVLGF